MIKRSNDLSLQLSRVKGLCRLYSSILGHCTEQLSQFKPQSHSDYSQIALLCDTQCSVAQTKYNIKGIGKSGLKSLQNYSRVVPVRGVQNCRWVNFFSKKRDAWERKRQTTRYIKVMVSHISMVTLVEAMICNP